MKHPSLLLAALAAASAIEPDPVPTTSSEDFNPKDYRPPNKRHQASRSPIPAAAIQKRRKAAKQSRASRKRNRRK
jgi:hypothetical protein